MIVFGDCARRESTQQLIAELHELIQQIRGETDSCRYHDHATSLLIGSGELWQGLLDEQCRQLGLDEWSPLAEHCGLLGLAAAALALRERSPLAIAAVCAELNWLSAADLPDQLTIKTPKGYAFYALYPRLYAIAAESLRRQPDEPVAVIGLRSIGTSLAAAVACAVAVATPPITLRPQGHPFRRSLEVGALLAERILCGRKGGYAIVDEGPGLSGSSFVAVADWLKSRSVREEQLVFFPSHGNDPGHQATSAQIARWRSARRQHVDFSRIAPDVLAGVHDARSGSRGPVLAEDISGGDWRRRLFPNTTNWPPAHVQQERRKFLLRDESTVWVAKFAGLGRYGRAALERGLKLSAARLIPQVRELHNGFLIGPWLASARSLLEPRFLTASERDSLLDRVARYLEFLAEHFRTEQPGATLLDLWNMARHNVAERFGSRPPGVWSQWESILPVLMENARPVNTDNKMQPWEWLRTETGDWLKSDAMDHHADHQCIGPQDIAWDVAGAICELELDDQEADRLRERLRRRKLLWPSAEADRFYQHCYLAFQIGYCTLAESSTCNWSTLSVVTCVRPLNRVLANPLLE